MYSFLMVLRLYPVRILQAAACTTNRKGFIKRANSDSISYRVCYMFRVRGYN